MLELADIFSLTIDGAQLLFGYGIERIRDYDLRLNGGRKRLDRLHAGLEYVFRYECESYTCIGRPVASILQLVVEADGSRLLKLFGLSTEV